VPQIADDLLQRPIPQLKDIGSYRDAAWLVKRQAMSLLPGAGEPQGAVSDGAATTLITTRRVTITAFIHPCALGESAAQILPANLVPHTLPLRKIGAERLIA
jgi:hypothetical protein